jgi:cardiolipin synthase
MPRRNLRRRNRSGYLYNNSAQLYKSGREFFEALEKLIDNAVFEIHFQTYIFAEDETGHLVSEALIRAARRGVKIFLLIDAYGSNNLSTVFINRMKAEKIELRFFGELFKKGKLHIGRRLHRKVIVIDRIVSVVAGINISNNYNSFPGSPAWLDFSIVVKGEISGKLHQVCAQSWLKIRFRRLSKRLHQYAHSEFEKERNQVKLRVRQNDWKLGKNHAARSYYQLIRQSQNSLIIVGGYFLPGRKARRLLRKASGRGVAIKLIVAARSDVGILRSAMLFLYSWLLRNKIEIYEYLPSNVHGKVIVSDNKIFSIGSYDLNTLSTYSNIELNLDVDDESMTSHFIEKLEKIMAEDCKRITTDFFKTKETIRKRLARWFAYRIVKSLFVLSIWLARKDESESYQ